MQKTRLGVSVGLLGAVVFFTALINNFLALILIAGYILFFESNEWLKKAAVKAVFIAVAFALVNPILAMGTDVFGFLNTILSWFEDVSFRFGYPWGITVLINNACDFIRIVLLLVLGFKALSQGNVRIGSIDNSINKHMQ